MKLKKKVKSSNNYPPHTPREGKGAYSTYLALKDNYLWMRHCSMRPPNTRKNIFSENNLFGLHKIAWCP